MNEEENKKLIDTLNNSPDFLSALLCAKKNLDEDHKDEELIEIDMRQIALFFYHAGYVANMEYEKNKDKMRAFVNKVSMQ